MAPLASAADDEEITDVLAYQTALDDSVNAARSLVESWIPKGLDASWDAPGSSAEQFTAVSLASKARPPRLGLGASSTEAHKLAAEERKLRDRLLKGTAAAAGPGSTNGFPAVGSASLSSKRELEDDPAEDSADDEDSRATAIKRKATVVGTAAPTFNSTAPGASKPKKKKRDKTSRDGSPATAITSTPQKAAAAPLPSTPLPPPSASTSSTPTLSSLLAPNKVSTTAFYGDAAPTVASSTSAASPPPARLTKNQRKKEREKERERMMKAAKIAAMHAEDAKGKGRASDDVEMADGSDALPPTPPSPVKLPRAFTKAPFAPLTSSSESEDVKAESDDEPKSDDDEGSSHPSSVAGSVPQTAAGDGSAKKKKKRRKKGKGARPEGGAALAPVLDLRPLSVQA